MGRRIVIIGAGAAGASAAARARRLDPEAEIVMFDKGPFISHAPCGIPYYVGGVVKEAADLAIYSPEEFARERRVDVRINAEVTEIDLRSRTVKVREGNTTNTYQWDKLIIATGAKPITLPVEGSDLKGILTLRLPHEAPVLRAEVERARVVAVVGGGYIGLEMAEALVNLGKKVILFEMMPHVLPTTFDEDMAKLVHDELAKHGVELHLNEKVVGFSGVNGEVRKVITEKGEYEVDKVVMGVGVRPDTDLAVKAGIKLGETRAIWVNEYMETSEPDVYAAGDVAETWNLITGKRMYIALAPPANKMGQVAGANAVKGRFLKFPGVIGTAITKVFDLYVARTGLTERQAREEGFKPVSATIRARTTAHYYPGGVQVSIKMVADEPSGRVLGVQIIGPDKIVAGYIDTAAALIGRGATIDDVFFADLSYSPPTAPVWHPIITAARVLSKGRF
ncbi:FAD-dependent oxidoreductase [Vulcanisaeta thermophila]|uniref:FAD-dependent oxidoreductase n=1 Tax=Vulcanisaeta thermophila TaxID=867917 RepID=UPI00085332DB|nr:FAD-dependent oxidoreductase [Vulcanisaeta thermophila]